MIYLLLSFFLDLIVSNCNFFSFHNLNLLFPAFFLSSIPFAYIISKNSKLFLVMLIVLSLLYDLFFSSIFFINTIFFGFYYYILSSFNKDKLTIFNLFIISVTGLIFYDFYLYLMLTFLGYSSFEMNDFYYKVLNSLFLNVLYIDFLIFISKSRIFGYKKSKVF